MLPKEEFAVYGGQSDFLIRGLIVGSAGYIAASANAFPKTASKVYDLYTTGKIDQAVELQRKAALSENPVKSGIALTKYAAAVFTEPLAGSEGAEKKLNPRTPYSEPSEEVKSAKEGIWGGLLEVEQSF